LAFVAAASQVTVGEGITASALKCGPERDAILLPMPFHSLPVAATAALAFKPAG
jgi:hypothetical protein